MDAMFIAVHKVERGCESSFESVLGERKKRLSKGGTGISIAILSHLISEKSML